MKTGLNCCILESKSIGNCSNGGLSSKVETVTLVDPAVDGPFEPDTEAPEVKLVRRNIGGRPYVHAEPVVPVKPGNVGYCFGGTYISTSDSRFPADYPIPLHDRQDTQEDYDHLSI